MNLDDLVTLVEADLGPPVKTSGKWLFWLCPFHDEKTPSFGVTNNGDGWYCFGCGKSGDDAIAYRVARGQITRKEAAELRNEVDPSGTASHRRRSSSPSPPPAPVRDPGNPPPAAWREQAAAFVGYCQEKLFTKAGRVGLEYLRGRGLTNATVRAWGLGYHEAKRFRPPQKWGLDAGGKKIYLPAGVVIPWSVDGETWHVKTRRLGGKGPKYIQVRGGQPALYGLDLVKGSRVLVICEGELDAVLLWQEAGDLVDVVAIGSKTARVPTAYLGTLAKATRWLVAFDVDAEKKAQQWGTWSARVRRARPLQGNDLTDFHLEGGDLRRWVTYHLERIEAETQRSKAKQAQALLDQAEVDPEEWRMAWAELAQGAGWPCYGKTWPEWACAS